jgi:hypothetical protein
MTDFRTTTQNVTSPSEISKDNNSESEFAPVGKSAVGYEFPYEAGE